jgi:nucleoside-diphosphate-sugar epimerase
MSFLNKPKIAILGATGYIGRSLYPEILSSDNYEVYLFSRDIKKLSRVALKEGRAKPRELKDFGRELFEVVVNATGVGDSSLQRQEPNLVFSVTEEMDNLVINYLRQNPETLYVNLSSGAVFGSGFTEAITDSTLSRININQLKAAEYYSVAKLNAEVKHRSLSNFNIVDLRVYAFFSQYVDTKTEFLMSELVTCLKEKTLFKTSEVDIARDCITPVDLWSLIQKVIEAKRPINDAYDVYSLSTVTKFELLTSLASNYGLEYQVTESAGMKSGFSKNVYHSENKKAESLGYQPNFSSLTGILNELEKMKANKEF